MKDKEMLDDIKKMTQNVTVPEELLVENVSQKLSKVKQDNPKSVGKKIIIGASGVVAAVAVICLTFGVLLRTVGVFGYKYSNGEVTVDKNIIKTNMNAKGFYTLDSYDSVIEYYEKQEKAQRLEDTLVNMFEWGWVSDGAVDMPAADVPIVKNEGMNMESAPETTGTGSSDVEYSDTELRTEGVLEGDVVKTDGKHIYVARKSGDIDVYAALGADTKKVAIIESVGDIEEMYLYQDNLIVLTVTVEDGKDVTKTFVYDIKDTSEIEKKSELVMDGAFETSRLVDGYLYTFTRKGINVKDEEKLIPYVDGDALPESQVYVTKESEYHAYLIVTALDLEKSTEYASKLATIMNSYTEYYVSKGSIYVYNNEYKNGSNYTELMKFVYGNGDIEAYAKGSFLGRIDDTFCIDEYNDYLRVVVTTEKTFKNDGNYSRRISNALYVFDKDLKEVGRLEDMAVDETVYSALFKGDVVYFVTYLQTDPLFSVDLSDPANPKLIGALKIPGFSDYMRSWGNDKMLGFGYDDMKGNKISLFDISDPANVVELDVTTGEKGYMYDMSVLYNYKAVLADYEKNILGFAAYYESYESFDSKNSMVRYFIYKIEDNQLVEVHSVAIGDGMLSYSEMGNTRGLYVGDNLYIVIPESGVLVYDMDTMEFLTKVLP